MNIINPDYLGPFSGYTNDVGQMSKIQINLRLNFVGKSRAFSPCIKVLSQCL